MKIKIQSFPFHLGNLHVKVRRSEIKHFLEADSDLLAPNCFSCWLVCFHKSLSLEELRVEPGCKQHLVAGNQHLVACNHQMNPTVRIGLWAGGIVWRTRKRKLLAIALNFVGVLAWALCLGTFKSIHSSSLHRVCMRL